MEDDSIKNRIKIEYSCFYNFDGCGSCRKSVQWVYGLWRGYFGKTHVLSQNWHWTPHILTLWTWVDIHIPVWARYLAQDIIIFVVCEMFSYLKKKRKDKSIFDLSSAWRTKESTWSTILILRITLEVT